MKPNGKAVALGRFKLLGAQTGRTSSSQPNLSNIRREVTFRKANEARRLCDLLRTFGFKVHTRRGEPAGPMRERFMHIALDSDSSDWWQISFVQALRSHVGEPVARLDVARRLLVDLTIVGLESIALLSVHPEERFGALVKEEMFYER